MKHYNVLIVTPGSEMDANYVSSLTETLTECNNRGITYKWLTAKGSLVHQAREAALTGKSNLNPDDKGPLNDTVTYDKLFMIDSDITWKMTDFFRLYDSDKDVICGAYLLADGVTSSISQNTLLTKSEILRLKGLQQIQGSGLGFVCVKSGVFEKLTRPWFTYYFQQVPSSNGSINITIGEDLTWCIKVKEAGFSIYFDPTVLVGHVKSNIVKF